MTLPCLVLAAGFGTRMGELTAHKPKPLIRVAGRTLLDHALDAAHPAQPIAVNVHYRAEQIVAHLAKRRNVTILHEAPEILDSGGAVKNAAQRWAQGPMATLNADNVWTGTGPVAQLIAAFDPGRMGALLLLTPLDRATGREGCGDFSMDDDGRLTRDQRRGAHVYTGAQILTLRPALPRRTTFFRSATHGISMLGRACYSG